MLSCDSLAAPKILAAPKYLLPPDSSSDIDTACFFGPCIKFFNLFIKDVREFVSFEESFVKIRRAFPLGVLLALTVPLVDAILKIEEKVRKLQI